MKAEFKTTKKEFEPIEVTITLESMDEAMTLAVLLNNRSYRGTVPSKLKNISFNDMSNELWFTLGDKLELEITKRK